MSEWFADSFFFLALRNPKDQGHAQAMARLGELAKHRLVTTAWVITEVADALVHPRNRSALPELLRLLTAWQAVIVGPDAQLFEEGIDFYQRRPDKEWSLTDCISFVTMTERGITDALTGDQHFTQAGFTALLT